MRETDLELIVRCAGPERNEAFAELVRRYANLVYSAALRQTQSAHLAEDVSQAVFVKFAREMTKLRKGTVLSAWLYQVARRQSIDVIRSEVRRRERERIAGEMNATNTDSTPWTSIEGSLDDAMDALSDLDRTAVLLRYFEKKSLREVAGLLAISENAAQKRLSRAVDRMRQFLANRGVPLTASTLIALISANAIQVAPAALASTLAVAAKLIGTSHSSLLFTTTKGIAMSAIQKSAVIVVIAALTATEAYRLLKKPAQERETSAIAEVAALTRERDELRRQVAALKADAREFSTERAELNRLRNEAGRSRPVQARSAPSSASQSAQGTPPDLDENVWRIQVEAHVKELTEKLGLTQDQADSLKRLLRAQALDEHNSSQKLEALPPDAPVLSEVYEAKEQAVREIEQILNPQQIAAYRAIREETLAASARASASGELIEMQRILNLSQKQQDAVFPAVFEEVLKEKRRMYGFRSEGDSEPVPQSMIESTQQSAERRLAALGPILTAEQLEKFKQVLALRRIQAMQRR
jgi:RNA polymerase sigma factor (sigma-70 family)